MLGGSLVAERRLPVSVRVRYHAVGPGSPKFNAQVQAVNLKFRLLTTAAVYHVAKFGSYIRIWILSKFGNIAKFGNYGQIRK